MNLAKLIESRTLHGAGSLRDMEQRAAEAGTPISRTTLGEFASGKRTAMPTEDIRRAIASAIGATYDDVSRAAFESAAPGVDLSERTIEHAEAWIKLTAGRSEAEIDHLLKVVEVILQNNDAARDR